nr:MAG TPA: Nitrogen fixation protein NifW [Caudoviricetes sp.]
MAFSHPAGRIFALDYTSNLYIQHKYHILKKYTQYIKILTNKHA